MLEHVLLQVDARRDLDQLERPIDGPEHRPLGDEHRGPSFPGGERRAVAHVLDTLTNFLCRPSFTMRSPPSTQATSSPPAVKVPLKMTCLAFWLMLMKPPRRRSCRRSG